MKRTLISSGSSSEEEAAYSRAVIAGNWMFISGTTGYNLKTMHIEDDIIAQTEQTFKNICSILQQANFSLKDVVRITYIVPNPENFKTCWPILNKYLKDIKPAATMLSALVPDPKVQIEIEVTALKI